MPIRIIKKKTNRNRQNFSILESEYLLKHDPCGMPTHNYYPFDASKPIPFWIAFACEALLTCNICILFSMVTAIILGITAITVNVFF